MCILIDNSGSMRDKRARVKAAALALVKASNPHDQVCIVDFNDEVFNDLPSGEDFTSDIKEMEEALTHIDSRGGNAMRDAIRMSIDHVEQTAHNDRKVLVVVTDGNDTSSTVTQEQLLGKVKNSGVPVYCIGLLNEVTLTPGAARLALGQLAEVSGGLISTRRILRRWRVLLLRLPMRYENDKSGGYTSGHISPRKEMVGAIGLEAMTSSVLSHPSDPLVPNQESQNSKCFF